MIDDNSVRFAGKVEWHLRLQGVVSMQGFKAIVVSGLAFLATPALADSTPKLDRNDPNAIRCKQLMETGSLVRKQRVCKTNAEWRAIREQQSRDADDLVTRNRAGMNPNG